MRGGGLIGAMGGADIIIMDAWGNIVGCWGTCMMVWVCVCITADTGVVLTG